MADVPLTMQEVFEAIKELRGGVSNPSVMRGMTLALEIVCGAIDGGLHDLDLKTGLCKRCGAVVLPAARE